MKHFCNCNSPIPAKAYGYYHQVGRLYNSALYGGIRLEAPPVESEHFSYDASIITVTKAGIYLITYIVNFPSNTVVTTTLAIQINNRNVPGTVRTIQRSADSTSCTVTAQAIVNLEIYSSLRLSSSSIIDYSTEEPNTVASVSIVAI